MPDTLTVRVPGRYPSINQWNREIWQARMRKAAKWKGDTILLTRTAIRAHPTPWPPATWADLVIRHHVRALRRRDADNHTAKPVIDGLVVGGALADDNSEVLRKSSVEFVRDGKEELELIVTRLDRPT